MNGDRSYTGAAWEDFEPTTAPIILHLPGVSDTVSDFGLECF